MKKLFENVSYFRKLISGLVKKFDMEFQDQYDWTENIERKPIYSDDKDLIFTHKTAKYVSRNIPGPGCNIDDFEEKLTGCRCRSCENGCQCVSTYGKAYLNNRIQMDFIGSTIKPVFECNMNCKCPPSCSNRVIQNGIRTDMQIFLSKNKGLGLRTLENISCGTFVCEYAGEILSIEEARFRAGQLKESDMNYTLTVKEHCKNEVLKTFVDPSKFGNIGRYINHSCEPNLVLVPVRVDNMVPRICLFAIRDIEKLEELAYRYGDLNNMSEKSKGNKQCFCSSVSCSGYLPFDEELYGTFCL